MVQAVELLRQGRTEELWQMCCGFTNLTLEQFMSVQKRLLLEQLELLKNCEFGNRILRGAIPNTVEEFRQQVPLTIYADYCPDLLEKREDKLPAKPDMWVRTSGRSGEYPCRWVPMTSAFSQEMSAIMYGIGILASCQKRGSTSGIPAHPRIVYTVAPRPYVSGAMAHMLGQQTPVRHMPPLEVAEGLSFEDRVKLSFKQAMSQGIDYFFGLSLVLAAIGDKFTQSSNKIDMRYLFSHPRALLRLTKGLIKSKLARRKMLPKDLWSVKGIISSGLDSWVYKEKIKSLWGRYPLDVYSSTEGGIIATQTWDYDTMTFIPNLNFLEFIPEDEHFKWQLDRSYQPKTLLLDEVEAGENYELVITNFHGGVLVRYRIGDMVKITSLQNKKLGINLPQMVFERRADGLINFVVIQLTEKIIWQAIERSGVAYTDWTAYKKPGEPILHLFIELQNGCTSTTTDIATAVQQQILNGDESTSGALEDLTEMFDFSVEVTLLPSGAFARYTSRKQEEGADLAHIKPPHLDPSNEVLALLLGKPVEVEAESDSEAVMIH